MLIKDVMTFSPVCCQPADKLNHVAAMMVKNDCGFIPICEGPKLVGVITDRDITCRAVSSGKLPADVPVGSVMTKPVFTVRQDQDVEAAIELMEKQQIRRLPVVDDDGKVVGIVAPSDLAPTFASTDVADFLLAVSYWTRKPAPSPVV
ncbi:MAG: CBS domain-containing protein [Acidobacteriota bacterium]